MGTRIDDFSPEVANVSIRAADQGRPDRQATLAGSKRDGLGDHVSPAQRRRRGVHAGRPALLVLSSDSALVKLVTDAGGQNFSIRHSVDHQDRSKLLLEPDLRVVVFDDEGMVESDRPLMLGQIRRVAPGASVLYVAADHDGENERRARVGGAHYYTSKPLDEEHFASVLRSFLTLHHR
jgi:hypothetical protein